MRALLERLPLGKLVDLVVDVNAYSDSDLVELYKQQRRGTLDTVALDLAHELVAEEPFDTPGDDGLIYAVEAALLGARGRLDGEPKAAECIESIDAVLPRLAAAKAASGRAAPAADTWHGQREKWRGLIEHLRERRGEMKRRADAGDECAGVLHDELNGLLTFIGTQQPDPRPPGEPRDLLRVRDEVKRRHAIHRLAAETSIDAPAAAVADELGELLAFMAPLHGAPLPSPGEGRTAGPAIGGVGGGQPQERQLLSTFVYGRRFYELMQAYRHANIVTQNEVTEAFEAVRTALVESIGAPSLRGAVTSSDGSGGQGGAG